MSEKQMVFKGDSRTKRMNLIRRLKKLQSSSDIEVAHIEADRLLIEYIGDKAIAKAFEDVPRWYS